MCPSFHHDHCPAIWNETCDHLYPSTTCVERVEVNPKHWDLGTLNFETETLNFDPETLNFESLDPAP